MPLLPIPINKGVYQNADDIEVSGTDYAYELRNLLLNESGSNVDRPGLSQFARIGNFGIIGMAFFRDKLFVVTSERKMWSISSVGAVTDVTGTGLEGTERPVFDNDGTYLAIAGGGTPRRWSGTGNSELMPGSPEHSTHIAYIDGYWINFLLDDQELRLAGPTSATRETWNSSDFFQAEGLPDSVVAIRALQRQLFIFGSSSIEVFQNFGDTSTPFQRASGGFIDRGTVAPYSVVSAENTLWFLDSKRNFVLLDGINPISVSSPYDRAIQGFTTVSDCWGTRIEIGGHYLIAWTFPSEERTFVFDTKGKHWSEWDGFTNESSRMRLNCYAKAESWQKHFVGDPTTGIIYELSLSHKADGAHPLRRLRQTGYYDHGTGVRKRSNYYNLHVKRGVGTLGGTDPKLLVRVNDDNKGWSNYREVCLGFPGCQNGPIQVRIGGVYRKRKLEFFMTDPAELRIVKLEEDVDLMVS